MDFNYTLLKCLKTVWISGYVLINSFLHNYLVVI